MPNYVTNRVDIVKLNTPAQYIKAIRELTTNFYDTNSVIKHQYFDFNKIIPEPKTKEECPEKYVFTSDDESLSHDDGKTWFNWYDWRLEYWGTKWNVSESKIKYNHNSITFVFSTAWSFPAKIVNKLARMGYEFEWSYADEDTYSDNSGVMTCEQLGRGEYEIHEEHDMGEDWMKSLWDNCFDIDDGAMCK